MIEMVRRTPSLFWDNTYSFEPSKCAHARYACVCNFININSFFTYGDVQLFCLYFLLLFLHYYNNTKRIFHSSISTPSSSFNLYLTIIKMDISRRKHTKNELKFFFLFFSLVLFFLEKERHEIDDDSKRRKKFFLYFFLIFFVLFYLFTLSIYLLSYHPSLLLSK